MWNKLAGQSHSVREAVKSAGGEYGIGSFAEQFSASSTPALCHSVGGRSFSQQTLNHSKAYVANLKVNPTGMIIIRIFDHKLLFGRCIKSPLCWCMI